MAKTISKDKDVWAWTALLAGLSVLMAWGVQILVDFDGQWNLRNALIHGAFVAATVFCAWTARAIRRLANQKNQYEQTMLGTLERLSSAIEAVDGKGSGHLARVADYACRLARHMGLQRQELIHLQLASFLHDVGKLVIPAHILHKTAPLSEAQWEKVKSHPSASARILAGSGLPETVIRTIYHHHERWDGLGYPGGLAGRQIPIAARILTLADAFDSIRSERADRAARNRSEACRILKRESGSRFDPNLVEQFLVLISLEDSDSETTAGSDAEFSITPNCLEAGPGVGNDIEESSRESARVMDVTGALSKSLTIEEAMRRLLPQLRRLSPYTTLALYVMNESSGVIAPRFLDGENREQFGRIHLRPDRGILGWAIANRRSMIIIQPELDLSTELPDVASAYQSSAIFPLIPDGKDCADCLGSLVFYFQKKHVYSNDGERRLRELVERIGFRVAELLSLEAARSQVPSDSITRLPNQGFLYAFAERELAKARRHIYPVSILEMEIDNYHELAQELPPGVLASLLQELVRTLRGHLREGDLLARVSETEFTAFLTMTSYTQSLFLLRRLENDAEVFRYPTQRESTAQVRMSFGCAGFPDHGRTFESLILRANSNRLSDSEPSRAALPMGLRRSAAKVIPFHESM